MTDAAQTPAPAPAQPPLSKAERRARWWAETKVDLKWATALLFVLLLGVSGYLWSDWKAEPTGEEDVKDVADLLFTHDAPDPAAPGQTTRVDGPLLAPFEILSILLLAALVAGVVIALRDTGGD